MSLVEPGQKPVDTEGPLVEVVSRISWQVRLICQIPTDGDEDYSTTFVIRGEDHTLLNALRVIIMQMYV